MSLTLESLRYLREATCMVLDQHEIILAPNQLTVSYLPGSTKSNRYLVSLEDGPDQLIQSIRAVFTGDERGGTVELGCVRTKYWEAQFDTVDTFRGTDQHGKPLLLQKN